MHGMSQMLGEGYIYDELTGTQLNSAVYTYKTLTSMDTDINQVNVVCDSRPSDVDVSILPHGCKGAAEGIYSSAWPAIQMAVYNAIKGVGGTKSDTSRSSPGGF